MWSKILLFISRHFILQWLPEGMINITPKVVYSLCDLTLFPQSISVKIPWKQPLCLIPTHDINNVSVLTLGDSMNMPHNRELSNHRKLKGRSKSKENKTATYYNGFWGLASVDYIIPLLLWAGRIWSPFVSKRMCVRAKTQSCSICILLDPCVLHIISHSLCSPATECRSFHIQGSIHTLLAVSREMVLISCLDSVEGARGLGELFSICEFRMVNNGKSFGL